MDKRDTKTPRERIQSVLTQLKGPTSTEDIADRADVPTDEARDILNEISGDGKIANKYGNKYDVDLSELERQKKPAPSECHNCGTIIEPDEILYEIHWERYDAEKLIGNGWAEYCADCAPTGIPDPQ